MRRIDWPSVKLSYMTLLWMLMMVGVDRGLELGSDTKMVILVGVDEYAWVDRNFSAPGYYPARIFDAQGPLVEISTLDRLAKDVSTDRDVTNRVISYFEDNAATLKDRWQESNIDRLRALYAMNLTHLSHTYGEGPTPTSLIQYVKYARASSCVGYSIYQSRILDAFGLAWRYVAVSSGFHGWIEVKIDQEWEIFDATANVWINQSAFRLLDAKARQYRSFYSPSSDLARADARRYIDSKTEPHYFTAGALRMNMPGLGIYFMTRDHLRKKGLQIEIWPHFCPVGSRKNQCVYS